MEDFGLSKKISTFLLIPTIFYNFFFNFLKYVYALDYVRV
jgi:hypothetical protein